MHNMLKEDVNALLKQLDKEEEELSLHDKQMIEIMELMGWN